MHGMHTIPTMKALGFIISALVLMGGCTTPDYDNSLKLDPAELGTVAVLPFDGYRGSEMARFIREEFVAHGATVVSLVDGKVPQGVDHVVSGKLIDRPSLTFSGEKRTYMHAAYMDVTSTVTNTVIARSRIDSEASGLGRIHRDEFYLPDTASQLVVRLREVDP